MAPRKTTTKRAQKGGDDLDAKLQHAVTTLNELAASLSAVLESRGVTVPDAPAADTEAGATADDPSPAAEDPASDDTPASEETPADEEPASGGGKKKASSKKANAKKAPKRK